VEQAPLEQDPVRASRLLGSCAREVSDGPCVNVSGRRRRSGFQQAASQQTAGHQTCFLLLCWERAWVC
jgi:hypothetical protein